MPTGEGPTSVSALLAEACAALEARGVPDFRLDAELLLAEVTGNPRYRLRTEPGGEVTAAQAESFRLLVARRGGREPLQYLLGRQEFWSLELRVDPRVLVPRPETELVVEMALAAAEGLPGPFLVVDMGCGSGNIAIAVARELPRARVIAVDLSPGAADLAGENAARHGVSDRLRVVVSDLFAAFRSGFRADLIVSNPPYVAAEDLPGLQPEVGRYEPRLALDGGPGGLEIIRRLLAQARERLSPGGRLIFEAGFDQAERIGELARAGGAWAGHRVIDDLSGQPRVHQLTREG